jgi:hypothetical protein
MATCTITPTLAAPLGTRFLAAFFRYFGRSVVTRESVDQAWIDTGLGRLDAATLQDIGVPPHVSERRRVMEAWKLAAALDATRHF